MNRIKKFFLFAAGAVGLVFAVLVAIIGILILILIDIFKPENYDRHKKGA